MKLTAADIDEVKASVSDLMEFLPDDATKALAILAATLAAAAIGADVNEDLAVGMVREFYRDLRELRDEA